MSNDITQPQPASRLPQYGLVQDWSFIKGREQYIGFVSDWKAAYKYLSLEIRARKLIHRASQSNAAKPRNPKSISLIEQVPAPQFRNNYVADTLFSIGANRERSDKLLAQWLLIIRSQAKVKAREFYIAEHYDETKGM